MKSAMKQNNTRMHCSQTRQDNKQHGVSVSNSGTFLRDLNLDLINTLKTLFRLFRVLIDLQKYILSGAIKFVSVQSSKISLSLFEITRASVLFSRKFQMHFKFYESENFFYSFFHRIFESENFTFPFSAKLSSEMRKINLQKIVGNLLDKLRKLYMSGTVIQDFIAFLNVQK